MPSTHILCASTAAGQSLHHVIPFLNVSLLILSLLTF